MSTCHRCGAPVAPENVRADGRPFCFACPDLRRPGLTREEIAALMDQPTIYEAMRDAAALARAMAAWQARDNKDGQRTDVIRGLEARVEIYLHLAERYKDGTCSLTK